MAIRKIVAATILLTLFVLAACTTPKEEVPKDNVVVQLKWVHQAQFAGFYVAVEKGYYAEENIEVELMPGGPNIDYFDVLNNGDADFAVVRPEGILIERENGNPIIAIATIYRKNPFVLVSLADSGIKTPQDFLGKRIALSGTEAEVQFQSMMENLELDPTAVEIVPFDFDYTPFYNHEIDVMPAFAAGSLLDIEKAGYELYKIWPDDYGVHWYSDTIATTEKLANTNPDLVMRFLRATLKGYQFVLENPEEAAEISLDYADIKDYDVQLGMIEAGIPLIHTGEDHLGWMHAEVWAGMQQDLLKFSTYSQEQDIDEVYTLEFLNQIYGEQP
ncbi:ABC transporter substrate-binding protein [bacterium]|nr:ABC transporter substrate-binding protein [bacterium]